MHKRSHFENVTSGLGSQPVSQIFIQTDSYLNIVDMKLKVNSLLNQQRSQSVSASGLLMFLLVDFTLDLFYFSFCLWMTLEFKCSFHCDRTIQVRKVVSEADCKVYNQLCLYAPDYTKPFILLVFLFFTHFSLTTHLPCFIRSVCSSADYSLFFGIRPDKRFGLQLFYLHLKHLHLDLQLHYLLRMLISMLCYMNPTPSMRYYLITAQYGVLFRVYSITEICCLLQCYYQLLQRLLHLMF